MPNSMAESIGIEPIHRLPSDGLANRCLAARPTLRILVAGPGIAPGTRAYETLEILLLQPAIDYLKNLRTIHLSQIYVKGRGNKSSKSNGSGISFGALL